MQTTTAPAKSVLSGGKASLSLPSPTSSNVSETSDYQRSTPSPKNSDENGAYHIYQLITTTTTTNYAYQCTT